MQLNKELDGMNKATCRPASSLVPKTKADALNRMMTAIAVEAIDQNEHAPSSLTRQTPLNPHWMFRACSNEAKRCKWPLKNGRLTWTSGDTVARFLEQLDLPE